MEISPFVLIRSFATGLLEILSLRRSNKFSSFIITRPQRENLSIYLWGDVERERKLLSFNELESPSQNNMNAARCADCWRPVGAARRPYQKQIENKGPTITGHAAKARARAKLHR